MQSKMPNVLFGIDVSEFMKNGGFKKLIMSLGVASALIFFFVYEMFTDKVEKLIVTE